MTEPKPESTCSCTSCMEHIDDLNAWIDELYARVEIIEEHLGLDTDEDLTPPDD